MLVIEDRVHHPVRHISVLPLRGRDQHHVLGRIEPRLKIPVVMRALYKKLTVRSRRVLDDARSADVRRERPVREDVTPVRENALVIEFAFGMHGELPGARMQEKGDLFPRPREDARLPGLHPVDPHIHQHVAVLIFVRAQRPHAFFIKLRISEKFHQYSLASWRCSMTSSQAARTPAFVEVVAMPMSHQAS